MSSIESINHSVEIYTASQCWRGALALPSMRRLSDFFNDQMHEFCNLTAASLLTWDHGRLVEQTTFAAMAIHIKTILAVVRTMDPSPVKADALQRVQKQPSPILVYAPPFTVEGQLHLHSGAQVFETIDGARQNFVPLTNGMLSLDRVPLLPMPAELVLVNRNAITAFRGVA